MMFLFFSFFRCSEVDMFAVVPSGRLSKLRPAYVCEAS
jgi:hypothetical protein